MTDDRSRRLDKLKRIHPLAAVDHRLLLDGQGRHQILDALPRNERRQLAKEARRLGLLYVKKIDEIKKSGAGYRVDKILREFAIEYTNRYASSGLHNQPTSFNYIEPFCNIDLLLGAAPYAEPAYELDHLFSVIDYVDFVTSPENNAFKIESLMEMPEARVFHYTPNGSVTDFTFANAGGREFLVGGFAMVRRGKSLHWYVIGGEVFSEEEWSALHDDQPEINDAMLSPHKRLFLQSLRDRNGTKAGGPVPLEGTQLARRTVIAGETDLTTQKHLGRWKASESDHMFHAVCDDPEVLSSSNLSPEDRVKKTTAILAEVERASVLWDLGELFFQLPRYFNHKVAIARSVAIADGKRAPATTPNARAGVGLRFKYVSAIEFVDNGDALVRVLTAPRYAIELGGYWRRLQPGEQGQDAHGDPVSGKTWVESDVPWRARPAELRPVYIKSSVAAARISREKYLKQAAKGDGTDDPSTEPRGVLYVLRCFAMEGETYKVGWTSGTAGDRAKSLSAASGVPTSFVVVDQWPHPHPEELEAGVHAMLAPYRVNDRREFFTANYAIIKSVVEAEIARCQG
ncbi:hypothetical protein D3C72_698960 [compost metagenome]